MNEPKKPALWSLPDDGPPPPPPPMRQEASITRHKFFYDVHSWAVYGMLVLDPKGYFEMQPLDLDDAALGRVARQALAASRWIPPAHPEWDSITDLRKVRLIGDAWRDRMKAAAGVKTDKAFYDKAANVSIRMLPEIIEISPRHNRGRGGWDGLPKDSKITLPASASDTELGAIIRTALDVSQAANR